MLPHDWLGWRRAAGAETALSGCTPPEKAADSLFEFLSPATVLRLSISCLISCHYSARDKKGGGQRETQRRIKPESETPLKRKT